MMKSKSFAARKSGDDGLRPELFDIVNGFLIDAVATWRWIGASAL